jgi:hypothetical protein
MRDGCPNCDHVLGLRGNNDAIQECTSQVFEGIITVNDPGTSWVARWQRLDGYVSGTYAVKVTGSVSCRPPIILYMTCLVDVHDIVERETQAMLTVYSFRTIS